MRGRCYSVNALWDPSGTETGRVDLGGRPPRPPTDPDVRVKRIWLFISWLRYAAPQAVDHSGSRKTVTLLQTEELCPRHFTISAAPRQPTSPDPSCCLPEFQEAVEVSSNPVIPVVASQLLRELLVLFPDRKMQILSAPLRQRE